jgi:MFS family permease
VSARRYPVLWLGAFAFYLSFLLLLSALPLFARRLGASDSAIGVIMGAFAVTSLALRPVAGWAADRWGRRPLMVTGAVVFVLASLAYGWSAGAAGLLLVRLAHGAGMGLYPTAASAMVADVTPPHRRGELLGLYGAAGSVALAVGPVSGVALAERLGFAMLFWTAGAAAAVALGLTLAVGETLARPRRVRFTLAGAVAPSAVFPSLLTLAMMFTYGVQIAFLPLHADSRGLNPGVFFLVFAILITLTRGPAGRLSDRFGRPPLAAAGLLLAAAALTVLALSEGLPGLVAAGVIYGIAYGTAQPALVAWCVDGAEEGERGRAMGTFYSALEIGIALGAMSSGVAVGRWGFTGTFLATGGVALVAAVLALARRR